MKKNVASQSIGAQMITAADGTVFTGSVTVYVTGDAGTQALGSVGSGVCTHEGNGYHTYAPAQAETNYDLIAFTFIGTGAIAATVQVFTGFPQSVDNATNISAILTDTAEIGVAGAGLTNIGTIATVTTLTGHTPQTGDTYALANGATGFAAIDTVVDAILVDTGTTIPATITTAQNDLDIITGAAGAVLDTTATSAQLVDDIWDEVLTGATHNTATSAGKRLRDISSPVIRAETAQGPGTGTNQIQLDTGASAVDGSYDPSLISIVAGTGVGQSRNILEYNGSTKTATVDRDWKVSPDATSEFVLIGDAGREHVNEGLAQAGGATSITLNALASSSDGVYAGQKAFIRSGTGADQSKLITAYNGTTKVATVDSAWATNPDSTSGYVLLPHSPVALSALTQASIDAIEADTNSLNDTKIPNTLNTTASGNIGIDWANVENPTTALDLSGTDIQLCDTVTTCTTTTTNTDMRGTDSAALASVCTEARLAELDAANLPADVDNILTDTGTTLPALIDDLAVKKNATFSNFEFLMVLTSDHVTPATGLTVTGERSIDGAAFTAVGGTIAEVSNGIYQFDALAADTNGDFITWRFSSATADDAFVSFKTVA